MEGSRKSVGHMRVEIKNEFWDGDENLRATNTQVTVKAIRMHETGKRDQIEGSRNIIQKKEQHKALKIIS